MDMDVDRQFMITSFPTQTGSVLSLGRRIVTATRRRTVDVLEDLHPTQMRLSRNRVAVAKFLEGRDDDEYFLVIFQEHNEFLACVTEVEVDRGL